MVRCSFVVLLICILAGCKVKPQRSASPEAQIRGLYVDSLSYILGDAIKERDLLVWCNKYKINSLSYYDLRRAMTLGKSAHLASFLKRARSIGVRDHAAVVESSDFLRSFLDSFNRAKPDTAKRFNVINLEREWWNSNGSFPSYVTTLSVLNKWAKTQSPPLTMEEYIGWFQKPSNEDLFMANELVKHSDRILVHAYQRNLSFSYIRERLSYLGQAAMAQKKVFPVIIIFSAEPRYSGTYFRTHEFDEAFRLMQESFRKTRFRGKDNIKLVGYQLFAYSFAKAATAKSKAKR